MAKDKKIGSLSRFLYTVGKAIQFRPATAFAPPKSDEFSEAKKGGFPFLYSRKKIKNALAKMSEQSFVLGLLGRFYGRFFNTRVRSFGVLFFTLGFLQILSYFLGDYLPQKLGMDPGENVLHVILPGDYKGFILFFFENGKVAKVPLSAYETKTNRRRLTGAYSDKSPLKAAIAMTADTQVALYSTDGRAAVVSTALLLPKTTRNTIGVSVMSLKKKAVLDRVLLLEESGIVNASRYRCRTIPTAGALIKEEDSLEKQISFDM